MPGFNYTAIDRNGKRVRSSLDASSIETAKSSLRGAGYTILDIKEQTTLNRDIEIPFLGKPKAKDMAVFCRQFVSILRAGVSVASVLAMLGQQTSNKKLRAAIREMQADVEKGEALATSMRRHPKIFPAILVNMVSAGEASGNLEESFRQMELYFERSKRTKGKVTSAMIYPCVLIVVMIIVLIVMMTKIIPNFLKTFEDMDAELPKLTQGVMAVCEWFKSWWWVPLLVLAALIVGGVLFHRTDKGKHFFGWLARKTPVVGNLTVKTACATFCRTVTGDISVTSGYKLYGMDSSAKADYTTAPTGKIVGKVTGTVAPTYETPKVTTTDGDTYDRYVAIPGTEADGNTPNLSFHHFNISVTGYRFELAAPECALFFIGKFQGDEAAKKYLTSLGFTLKDENGKQLGEANYEFTAGKVFPDMPADGEESDSEVVCSGDAYLFEAYLMRSFNKNDTAAYRTKISATAQATFDNGGKQDSEPKLWSFEDAWTNPGELDSAQKDILDKFLKALNIPNP